MPSKVTPALVKTASCTKAAATSARARRHRACIAAIRQSPRLSKTHRQSQRKGRIGSSIRPCCFHHNDAKPPLLWRTGWKTIPRRATSFGVPTEFDLFDQAYNTVLSAPSYVEFRNRLTAYNCQRCPRGKARSHIVIDRGNPGSKILTVSERPGDNEDVLGQAFVGRSGELLDKIMASIGVDTKRDLLIINVVKCRAE